MNLLRSGVRLLAITACGCLLVVGALTASVVIGFRGTARLEQVASIPLQASLIGPELAAPATDDPEADKGEQGTLLRQDFGGQGQGTVCGLVFGAAVHRSTLPGPGISRRVATAARLYHEGILQHIILSGGKGEDGMASEAQVMRDVALQLNVAAGDLTLEEESRSTWENLLNSKPLADSCTLVIGISDRYHLARIGYLAGVQGWEDIRTLPSDVEPPWPFELKSISREVAALLYYMFITNVFPLDDIAQHAIPDAIESRIFGLLITKSDHLVCQLIY